MGKTIWDKTKVLFGTSWGKYLRTLWEQSGKKKIPLPPPPAPPKEKNCIFCHCMLSLPIDCMKFFFPKWFFNTPLQELEDGICTN
jgi:hypothetical protein